MKGTLDVNHQWRPQPIGTCNEVRKWTFGAAIVRIESLPSFGQHTINANTMNYDGECSPLPQLGANVQRSNVLQFEVYKADVLQVYVRASCCSSIVLYNKHARIA